MKKILSIIGVAALLATSSYGQTPAPIMPPISSPGESVSNILNNLPTVPIAQEKIGVSVGTLMHGNSTFSSATLIDYTIAKNFFVRGEVDAGNSSTGIEAAGIGGGICKTFSTARIWGVMEGRRNFTPGRWEGLAGIGAAWTPASGSTNILSNFSVGVEQRIVVATGQKGIPSTETFPFIRYSFD